MATEKFTGFVIETLPDKYVKIKFPAKTSKSYGVSPAKPGFVKLDPTGEYVGSSKWIEYASVRDSFGMDENAVELLADDAIKFAHNRKPFPKMKQNPAPKRKTAARTQRAAVGYVNRPSQITKKAPSKRLKKRRTKNLQVPRGVFPNPSPRMDTGRVKSYNVYIVGDGYESYIKGFKTIKAAKEYIASIDTDRIYRIRPVTLVSMLDPIFEGNRRDFKVKKNPDSVHFDIDVNSHNARGAKAKTRVNPIARQKLTGLKNFIVQESAFSGETGMKTIGVFAKVNDAFEYAKARDAKNKAEHKRRWIKVLEG